MRLALVELSVGDGHRDVNAQALWVTTPALGGSGATCAIVGGMVALTTGHAGIPTEWLAAREALA